MNIFGNLEFGFIPNPRGFIYISVGYGFRIGLANYRPLPESYYPEAIYGYNGRKFLYNHSLLLGLGYRYRPKKSNIALFFELRSDLIYGDYFFIANTSQEPDKVFRYGDIGLRYVLPRTVFGVEVLF